MIECHNVRGDFPVRGERLLQSPALTVAVATATPVGAQPTAAMGVKPPAAGTQLGTDALIGSTTRPKSCCRVSVKTISGIT